MKNGATLADTLTESQQLKILDTINILTLFGLYVGLGIERFRSLKK
jgi:hypothetical protein